MAPFKPSDEDLFIEWLELPPDKRKGFLDTVSLDDQETRESLLALIEAYEESEGLFEVKPEEDFAEVAAEVQSIAPSDETAGDLIGRYRLKEKIGEGSWGSVWLAQQTEDINRFVALKILKLGLDTKDFLRRFEAERQMLAMMEHPSIATIHDAGSTEYGRPYLVMELVRGKPLLEYADEKKMTIEERVELYIRICQALDHAHQKGVIHRDIKPSNILVAEQDDEPVPKVIDFGVAKTNQFRLGNRTLFTSFHTFTGTPLYSSPEQLEFSGQVVDQRSDVYSLGVLLYEFLVGTPPYDHDELTAAGLDGMRKIVRETDPPLPSRRLANLGVGEQLAIARQRMLQAVELESQIKGDLDWIIMKCLEKDRKRRYQSAHELVDDLRAFLNDRPVSAAAPSILYRTRKFIHRNRLGKLAWAVVPGVILCIAGLFFYVKSRTGTRVEMVSPFAMALSEGNRSVAVLPFENLSANDADAFIAMGLHGELTNAFARIPDLKTISRESTLRYRDTSKSLATIGEDLGVITVVTGDVQRVGEHIRINVQLIDVIDDRTLWGESYIRAINPNDFFEVLKQMSKAIMNELGSLLSQEEIENDSVVPTQNLEALAAYFKGLEIYEFVDLTRYPESIELFEKAIELDPEFAEAYAGLAGVLFTSGIYLMHPGAAGYVSLGMTRQEAEEKRNELRERAFEVAAKGFELDESLLDLQVPFVFHSMHRVAGAVLELDESLLDLQIPFIFNGTDQEHTEFSRAFWERYIEERPNDPGGYMGMAYWHSNIHLSQFAQEARSPNNPDFMAVLENMYVMWKKTVELDPTHPWWRKELAETLRRMGRSDEYLEQLKLNAYHNPDVADVNQNLGLELLLRSRFDEAMIHLRKSHALGNNSLVNKLSIVSHLLGDNDSAIRWAERAKALNPRSTGFNDAYILRLRGNDEGLFNWVKDNSPPGLPIFPGISSMRVGVRNFDLRNGLSQEQRERYLSFDPLFFEDNVAELMAAEEVPFKIKSPAFNCVVAMELAGFLLATDEREQAERLLDGALILLERHSHPAYWRLYPIFYGVPGDTLHLYFKAVYHSLRGDNESALKLLREAVDAGFRDRFALSDARFDSFREDPEFIELITIVETDLAEQLANIRRMEANGEFAAIPKLPAPSGSNGR